MNGEESDQLTPLSTDNSIMQQILLAKTGEPSKFASFWEMDENDVEVMFIIGITRFITARVRSTTGGYVFTGVCLFNFRGGYPIPIHPYPYPSLSGRGGGVPDPALDGGGTPTLDGGGTPSPHPRVPPPGIASTCYGYAAGGVPLTFTQEDFLVLY